MGTGGPRRQRRGPAQAVLATLRLLPIITLQQIRASYAAQMVDVAEHLGGIFYREFWRCSGLR
jgi:hypothetical protein